MKKTVSLLLCAILVLSMLMGTLISCTTPDNTDDSGNSENGGDNNATAEKETKYNEGLQMISIGNYAGAYEIFKTLGDYKDSETFLSKFAWFPTVVNYDLSDRSGVMTVTLGENNLPTRAVSDGVLGIEGHTLKYSATGNLKKHEITYNGDVCTYAYTHDLSNNMIMAEYSVNGTVSKVHNYSYDPQGRLEFEFFEENGVIQYDCNNYYDDNGNLTKSEVKTPDVDYVYIYNYDADGNKISERGEGTNGSWYTIEYTYDENGKLTKERYAESDFSGTVIYTYDDDGNCIKEECAYHDGTKDVLTREYDANGNVTKEVFTEADGTTQTVETQYAVTYLTIQVPESTMSQIFDLLIITTDD